MNKIKEDKTMKPMTYRFLIDGGAAPFCKEREFQSDAEAIRHGEQMFKNCSSPYITLMDEKGKVVKEFF